MTNTRSQNTDAPSLPVETPPEDTPRTRRRILGVLGMAITATLAGCTSDDDGTDTDDDAADSQPGDDSADTDPSGQDDFDDGPDGSDADDEMASTDTDASGQDDFDDGPDGSDEDSETEPTEFGEIVSFANAYEFVVEVPGEDTELLGRFDGEHLYWRMEDDSDLVEMYYIGTDIYFVENEQECMLMASDNDMPGAEPVDPDMTDPEIHSGVDVAMTNVGTDTIEGDSVYVYEHEDDDGRMYVHADSGLPRRYVAPDAVVDWFYDDIAPVDPPELDCEELPDF